MAAFLAILQMYVLHSSVLISKRQLVFNHTFLSNSQSEIVSLKHLKQKKKNCKE